MTIEQLITGEADLPENFRRDLNPQGQPDAPVRRRFSYLTVLEEWRLDQACAPLWKVPGWHTYHVGSSTERRDFRDVDLRTILPDDEFDAIPRGLRRLLQMSVSQLLTVQSGLPIDWQLQPMREANTDETKGKPRNAMGLRARLADQEDDDA